MDPLGTAHAAFIGMPYGFLEDREQAPVAR